MKFEFRGLSASEVETARRQHGTNELPPPEVETFWAKLIENFDDPLIKILMLVRVASRRDAQFNAIQFNSILYFFFSLRFVV